MVFRTLGFAVVMMFALVACGPSATQVHTARTARYQVSAPEAFRAGVEALEAGGYRIRVLDDGANQAITVARWYESDGTYADKTLGAEGQVGVGEGDIRLAIELAVVTDGGNGVVVQLVPRLQEYKAGMKPMPIPPDSPQVPGWVTGKLDNLYLAIHDRLKGRAVTGR